MKYVCINCTCMHIHTYKKSSHLHAHIQHRYARIDVQRNQTLGTFYKVRERFGQHVLGCLWLSGSSWSEFFNHFEPTKNMSWEKTCIFWAKWMKCIYDLFTLTADWLRACRGCSGSFGYLAVTAPLEMWWDVQSSNTNIFWWRGWNLLFFSQPAIALYVFSAPPSACCCRETPQTCTYALCPHGWVDAFRFLFCCFL